MRAALLALALLPAAGGAEEVFTVYDRFGTLYTASNRIDGGSSVAHLQASNRTQGLLWERSHYDSFMERITAVAVDPQGSVYLAGLRLYQGAHYIWLMKFSRRGDLLWERADAEKNCTAFSVIANEAGEAWVAGSCIAGARVPVRLLRLTNEGGVSWAQTYDEGGRNYVRNLTLDFIDRATVTIEVNSGRAGSEFVRTVVFNRHGSRVAVY